MVKVNTVQMGDKLYIMDGKGPLRYVDLTKNKVVQYKQMKPKVRLKQKFWWLFPSKRKQVKIMEKMLEYHYAKINDSMIKYFAYRTEPTETNQKEKKS